MCIKIWTFASKWILYLALVGIAKSPDYRKQHLQNTIVQEYVLPDFINSTTGHIRQKAAATNNDQQILIMNNERFMIPEVLMHPSDIGLDQAGIPEAIIQSVDACDPSKSYLPMK